MRKFSSKLLWQGKFLKVKGKKFYNKDGKKCLWESVEIKGVRGIIMIFALTEEKEVVLAKQFRFPIEKYIVELPAGLLDKPGESPRQAARRELLEETGYKAKKLIFIGRGYFNPGITNNEIIFFLAPDITFVGFDGISFDDSEEIEVIKVPLKKLTDFCLKRHKNFVIDLKILNTLKILEEKKLIS